MARTKGAKDRQRRKGSKPGKRVTPRPPAKDGPSQTPATVQTTIESGDEQFRTAVEAVLGPESVSRGGPFPQGTASPGQGGASTAPPAAIEPDMVLGFDAWRALVEAPFRSLAIMLRIPAFEQLGRLRAQMLAQPSYPLYRHYVTQWLTDNPDDELFVAKIMTAAALATVIQEGWMIYVGEGQRRAAAAQASAEAHKVNMDALHTQN